MPDLVGNPEDRFSQNEAHFETLLDGKNLWEIAARLLAIFQENQIDLNNRLSLYPNTREETI